jgi:hypothetical protein
MQMSRVNTASSLSEEMCEFLGVAGAPSRGQRRAPLDEVLAYKHADVVHRFLDMYPIEPADAEELFTEVKRWLWLCGDRSSGGGRKQLVVTTAMAALDEMWHCFVLYTLDYARFCFRFFGRFIHHHPMTLAEKARMQRRLEKDPEGFKRSFARQMEWQYRLIGEQLGEETLRKWYIELPTKYPLETLQRLNAQSVVASPK